ncbi:BgTH12-01733, partial [Blumeria graminis f. sp. triticale]
SNKHLKAERQEAFQHLQNQKNKYNKRYTQFVAKCGQPESAIPESIHLSQLMSDLDPPDSEEFKEVYFTRFGPIKGKKYLTELNNEASLYALTSSTSNFKTRNPIIRYSDSRIFGIMINTGAAKKSTVRLLWYDCQSRYGPSLSIYRDIAYPCTSAVFRVHVVPARLLLQSTPRALCY